MRTLLSAAAILLLAQAQQMMGKGGKGGKGNNYPVGKTAPVGQGAPVGKPPSFLKNCTYWVEHPGYQRTWQNPQVRKQFEWLDREHDLRCCPKPDGPILDMGIVDPEAAVRLMKKATEADWVEESFRQKAFHVHSQTQSLVFLWKNNFQDQIEELPRWAEWEPLIQPAVDRFCEIFNYSCDEVDIWKAMLARMPAGADIHPHVDMAPALAFVHRVHWVLTSGTDVTTTIGGEQLTGERLGPGRLFEFNNVRKHQVRNAGADARVHAILDIVPKKMKGFGRIHVPQLTTARGNQAGRSEL